MNKTSNKLQTNIKQTNTKKGHFVMINIELFQKLQEIRKIIKEDCGDFMTFNEILTHIFVSVDENKFIEWLNSLAELKKQTPLPQPTKARLIKLIKNR